jgi:hypothetical protein
MNRKLSAILTVVMSVAIVLIACSLSVPATPPAPAAPTQMLQTSTPVICSDLGCFQPQFLTCTSSVMTMPFAEGSSYIITVFGNESGLCHYALAVVDKNGNPMAGGPPSSDCKVPIEKITKDTLGHFFGQDSAPGQEAIKIEQDKIQNDYCILNQPASNTDTEQPSTTESALNKVTCGGDDQNCIFSNVIDNFKNGCQPVEVTVVMTGEGTQVPVIFTISSGENGACKFMFTGLGADYDCLFAKENVREEVVKGMLGMDNIPNDPEFIKVKSASCK